VIGFVSHVDTSPEVSGTGVKPIVHERWDGSDIVLPDDRSVVLRAADDPELAKQKGNDVVTASGTTLLGADDKAGVAEIMGAVEWLMAHPEIPHGDVRVGFTPDEEIGLGTKHFDVAKFGARYAYTMDGESLGQLQSETFSADTITLTFHGYNVHPGYAKGKLVSAIKVAADFLESLPRDRLSPETTEGYEGYVHPHTIEGGVERTTVRLLVRDFATPGLADKERELERLARAACERRPGSRVEVRVDESYRNMKEVLDLHPEVVACAEEAMRRAGLDPRREPIRGGTDGSKLCFMGLPTPNVFAGGHAFHSRREWVSTHDMHKAVEVIVELCRVWEERVSASA
jgi:tripeptide aminopeptidase